MSKQPLHIESYKTVGEYIRSQRIALGISQRYLIEVADCSRPTISLLENNKNPGVSFSIVLKALQILKARGAPPIDLYRLSSH